MYDDYFVVIKKIFDFDLPNLIDFLFANNH